MNDLDGFLDFLPRAVERGATPKLSWECTDEPLAHYLPPSKRVLPSPVPSDEARMPFILARSLSRSQTAGWTYHPRSDRHSVIKCLGLLFDLLRASARLSELLRSQHWVFGVNSRACGKVLDLVIGEPSRWKGRRRRRTLAEMIEQYRLHLTLDEQAALVGLADLREGQIGQPHLAVEAKAVMTDHAGALPRVSDELKSFRERLQGEAIITAGLVMVNAAERFVSPGRNRRGGVPTVNTHRQPEDAQRVLQMVSELPRREGPGGEGFDVLGVVCVECVNDGSDVEVRELESLSYPDMVEGLTHALTHSEGNELGVG